MGAVRRAGTLLIRRLLLDFLGLRLRLRLRRLRGVLGGGAPLRSRENQDALATGRQEIRIASRCAHEDSLGLRQRDELVSLTINDDPVAVAYSARLEPSL